MLKNRRFTLKDLTDMIGISEGSVKTILKDHLGLGRVKSRLVPKTPNFLEKSRRVDVFFISETQETTPENAFRVD